MKIGPGDIQILLKQVSRSFYLTLHVLPRSVRHPLSLAYLLARATDTIADTEIVDVDHRIAVLLQLKKSIHDACEDQNRHVPDFTGFIDNPINANRENVSEHTLLKNLQGILEALALLPSEDRIRIDTLLDIITTGQEEDLQCFGAASADRISSFVSDEQLDSYTYKVAGCVGEFWTEMCRAHIFPEIQIDEERLMANAVQFGKGLQLVNILRDLPKDLRLGRCYLPQGELAQHGLTPHDLLNASSIDQFRPLYNEYLKKAENCLSAGWQYTISLPFRCVRIRLACAWPILIGMKTIRLLYRNNILDDSTRVKVSRSDIRKVMIRSAIFYLYPAAWNRLFYSPEP
jgi:farnesyl-diphosphate farnesyltransferase